MKKAKILLTAIGLFAIVGGALATKANRGKTIFCAPLPAAAGFCTVTLNDFTTLPFADPNAILKGYCTLLTTRPCPTLVGVSFAI